MAASDRKISLKVKWLAAICIIVGLIVITFVFIQYVVNENKQGTRSISKWGVTLNEPPAEDKFKLSKASLEEGKHTIGDYVSGMTNPPLGGQTESLHLPIVNGVAEKDLYITFDVDIDFPNDSFNKDGFFNCPLQFDSENKNTNQKLHFYGKDYTSKTKFRDDLLKVCDIFKDIKVPAGTNVEKFMEDYSKNCYISVTADKDFDPQGYQNVKLNLDCKFVIADEQNAM